jgi:hypothetical protein
VVTREDKIEQTISNLVRQKLTDHDYIPEVVDLREAFPTADERAQELTKSQVAVGFSFDDGGLQAEMGTDLRVYTHTVEFWSFGIEADEGRNVANFIKQIFISNMTLPLLDIGGSDEAAIIAYLEIPDAHSVSTRRQISAQPFPWDRFVWSTAIKIQDWHTPDVI